MIYFFCLDGTSWTTSVWNEELDTSMLPEMTEGKLMSTDEHWTSEQFKAATDAQQQHRVRKIVQNRKQNRLLHDISGQSNIPNIGYMRPEDDIKTTCTGTGSRQS